MQKLLSALFVELKVYYETTYNSLPVRLDQLILCVVALEEAYTQLVHQLTMILLNLKNSSSDDTYTTFNMKYFKK
jgi:hypothetical protein